MRDYKLSLNLITNNNVESKKFKQFDTGNEIELEVYQNENLREDEKLVLTNESVLAFFRRKDGQVLQKNCTIRNGNIIAKTEKDVLGVPGALELECLIKKGSIETTTQRIIFNVDESIARSGAIEEDPRYTTDLVTELLDVRDNVKAETLGKIEEVSSHLAENKNELTEKINEVATKGTTTEVLQATTESYINSKINDGTIANMTIPNHTIEEIKMKRKYAKIVDNHKWIIINLKNNTVEVLGTIPLKTESSTYSISKQTLNITPGGTKYLWFNATNSTLNFTIESELINHSYIIALFFEGNVNKLFNAQNIEVINPSGISDDIEKLINSKSYLYGKKIVWFGTSIPAGTVNGKTYPQMIGEYFGATVINESIGGSNVRAGEASLITAEDPYGWTGLAWQSVAYALAGTLVEKQYLIDNWSTWKTKLTNNPPDTLDTAIQNAFKDYSYENKLNRHLGINRADLYVFDHGYNDWFDGSDLDVMPADSKNRFYYLGAMNFLIDFILKDNPRARIIQIGHFENQFYKKVSIAQSKLAEYWSIPIYNQWQILGWSSNKITTTGYWENGYWIESGGDSRDVKVKDIWLPDGVHPHYDKSGKAINHIYSNMIDFFRNLS